MNAAVTTDLRTIGHWIGGEAIRGDSGRTGPVFNPATGEQTGEVDVRVGRRHRPRSRNCDGGAHDLAPLVALEARRALLPHLPAPRRAPRGSRAATDRRARQGALRRARRGAARDRGDRVRLRDPGAPEGRVLGAGLDRDRRVLDPTAARGRRRDHAVQLPRNGAHVDVGARDRVREHVHPQAIREGPVRVDPDRGDPQGGRAPRRRLQRRAGRQGRRRRDPRAPGHRGRLLRRLDADRALRLRDRNEGREARAGARRREEPHDRPPRRRHRHGSGRRRERRLRLGGRALHGDLGRRRGRRRRRRARERDQGSTAQGQGRRRPRPVLRDGPARHARAPRQGRVLPRLADPPRARRSSPTAARRRRTTAASSSASRCSTT